ncbi:MAG: MotA/TolQ/ExbB proton channel family protein [Pirellulales bacterium]
MLSFGVATQNIAVAQEHGAAEGGGEVTEIERESDFVWVIKTSGLIGGVLLIMSFWFIAICVRCFLEIRATTVAPPDVIAHAQGLIEQRDFRGLYTFVKADPSFFSKALAAGLGELPHGLHESREAMDRVADVENAALEKKISMLAVIGSLGPMIGLLGTLKGMIGSFSLIARSGESLKANEVAGHISEALLLTFEGVALSVPAIFLFAVFKNRIALLSSGTTLQADEMIRAVSVAVKTKAPPTGAPAAPRPPMPAPQG